jgi:hypothetical protein
MMKRADLGVRNTLFTIVFLACFLGDGAVAQTPTPAPLAGFGDCSVALAPGAVPIAMAADDFNDDGAVDLAVLDQANKQVIVLLTSPGAFASGNCAGATTTSTVALSGAPSAIAAGVLDTTGVVDLVVAIPSVPGVSILRNNGSGSFKPDPSPVSTGTDPEALAIADINRDGLPDIVVGSGKGQSVTVLYGQSTGGFVSSSPISVDGSVAFLLVKDFNNDSFPDIAAGSNVSGQVSILLQQRSAPGTFEPVGSFTAGVAPASMVAGDFNNNDDAPDLAVTRGDSTLGVFLNDGNGGFPNAPDATADTGPVPVAIVSGYFNPDVKNLDVAVATQGDSAVTFYRGDGTGAMTEFPNACGLPGVELGPCLTSGVPVAMVLGDVDGDRRDDVITANQNPASLTVLLSSRPAATPTFTATPTPTSTGTATPTATPTDTPTDTPTPTSTPTPTPTRTPPPTFTFTVSPTPGPQCIGGVCVQGQGCRIGRNAETTASGWWLLPAVMFWLRRRQLHEGRTALMRGAGGASRPYFQPIGS